jgi:hypothetical protein
MEMSVHGPISDELVDATDVGNLAERDAESAGLYGF